MSATVAPSGAVRPAMRALATVIDLLAEVYLLPDADVRDRAAGLAADGRLADAGLEGVVADLGRLGEAPAADLEVEYVRLYLHGRPLTAHPYESFYRCGLLADEACLDDLDALLRAAGVEPGGTRVTPDHLGVELDLLALLLSGLADEGLDPSEREAVRGLAECLLVDHLTEFVSAFVARVRSLAPDPYHLTASQLLTDAVAVAARLISAPSGRSDVGPHLDLGEDPHHQPQVRH